MNPEFGSLAFVLVALCVGAMGFAIQRGGTCTVAAVEELVEQGRMRKLAAMAEASLWVAGGLVLARALHLLDTVPAAYAVSAWTIAGGALLGLGAYVNGACVFGAIARLGSGEWVYLLTPLGFLAGSASVDLVFTPPHAQPLDAGSLIFEASAWLALPWVAFAAWRVVRPWFDSTGERPPWMRAREVAARVWSPHAATAVIGISFVIAFVLAGAWAYTDALAEWGRGMFGMVGGQGPVRLTLVLALFAGAVWGGWTAGRFRSRRPSATHALSCFGGGALMAWGSLLIPGSNDGLILIGMPLLWPYAWLAFGTMVVTIGGLLVARRAWERARERRAA